MASFTMSTDASKVENPKEKNEDLYGKPIKFDMTKLRNKIWQGLSVPYIYEDPEVHFPKVLNMQLRDDDILLCTFPKSGTHWIFRILDMLVRGSADYGDNHFAYGLIDMQVKDKRKKLVHMYRNPKAVAVSMHEMMKNVPQAADRPRELETALKRLLYGDADIGAWNWSKYMDSVIEFERNNPDVPILHVAYEDLKMNTVGTIQTVANFLNVPVSKELCQQIAEAVEFNRQKEEETKLMHSSGKGINIYREGVTDNWKHHLTVTQSEMVDQFLKERAHRCPFSAKYVS